MRMYHAHMSRAVASRKVATNVTVRPELVTRAKALGLNLSELLEGAIERAIRDSERRTWLAENEQAMDEYNAQIAKRGVFSDDWRRF